MQPSSGVPLAICRFAAAAAAGANDLLQQAHPPAVASILQQVKLLSNVPGQAAQEDSCPSTNPIAQQSVGSSSSRSPALSCAHQSSNVISSCSQHHIQPPLHNRRAVSAALAGLQRQQQQQQQWRSMSAAADILEGLLQQQQRQQPRQQLQQSYGVQQRSEFEGELLACTTVDRLAALLAAHPQHQPKESMVALTRLSKLNKAHRTVVKQQVKALQQHWRSLRPLNQEQQQRLQELKQLHAQHQADMQGVLATLVQGLLTDESSLHVEQLVQVLGALASLGCAQQVQNGSALLVIVLQRIYEGLSALQPRHLAFLATSVGQLQDAERGSSTNEDMPDQHTALEDNPTAHSSSPSPAVEREQQQQQAVSEVCRLLVPELCNQVQHCGSLMDATTLANFVAAMGRLGHYDWQTMRLVGTLATRQAHAFKAGQVAKVLTGLTKVRHYDVELCARLADAAERDMGAATGEQVAQIMWALAHQRYEQAAVFEAAALQVPSKVHLMQPRHVANTAWAFAVRKAYSPPLYDALAARMVQLIELDRGDVAVETSSSSSDSSDSSSTSTSSDSGIDTSSSIGDSSSSSDNSSSSSSSSVDSSSDSGLFLSEYDTILPHHLSLVAWSFAKQGHKVEQMMQAIGDRAVQVVGQMLPQNISNAAWAFGALGMPHPAMFDVLAAAAKASRLEGYNNQNITDLAWGFAQAGHQDPELFELVASATSSSLPQLSPHSLSDLITAFARARDPQAHKVLSAAAPAAVACMQRFSVQMLGDLLCSYAEVGLKDEELLKAAAQVLSMRISSLEVDTDAQAKIIWTMKQLGWRDEGLEKILGGLIPNLSELL